MNDAMCQIQSTRLAVDLDKPLITRTGKELYPNPLWIKERPGGGLLLDEDINHLWSPDASCYMGLSFISHPHLWDNFLD